MYDSISRGDDPHVEHYKQLHQPCQEFSRCNWPFDAVLFHGLQYWVIFRHIWHQGLWLPVLHQLLFFLHTNTHRSWHTSFQSLTNFSFSFFLHKVANILALLLQVPPPPSCRHCHLYIITLNVMDSQTGRVRGWIYGKMDRDRWVDKDRETEL